MTKHDLKEMRNLGAELGAAKAENERLRGLLERIRTTCCQVRDAQDLDTAPGLSAAESLHEQIEKLDAALSPQAEPADTFTAVDMATAAAQGFRDGQAAVEQSTAQSGLVEALPEELFDGYAVYTEVVRRRQAAGLNCLTAPDDVSRTLDAVVSLIRTRRAALSAQGAGKFAMGDRVRKTSGSEGQGRICGTYSTPLTPEGYAVESEAHAGSVQIYPAKALELVPMAAKEA